MTSNQLFIESESLFNLLEEIYYEMGKDVYDTYTHKQEEEGGNLFFTKNNDDQWIAQRFPKMNTYGLTELLTNNAQGGTRSERNTKKLAILEKEEPITAEIIKSEFAKEGIKVLSKIYFNERYTKITRLEKPVNAYFEEGTNSCYLTGESFKKLVDSTNISPFFSGLANFNSHLSATDKRISWKSLYLSRFSAAQCLYVYNNKMRDSLMIYFIHSNSLEDLLRLSNERFLNGIKKNEIEIKANEYLSNFSTSSILAKSNDYIFRNENLFVILYSLRDKVLKPSEEKDQIIFDDEELEEFRKLVCGDQSKISLSLVSIKADSFASTKRPTEFEVLNNFKYVICLIGELEKEGISINQILQSLKIIKPAFKQNKNKYAIERYFREQVIGKILKGKSILKDLESLFVDCYGFLCDNEHVGIKAFSQLLDFIKLYESYTNSLIMEQPNIQERAIKLGASIGQGILTYSSSQKEPTLAERKNNARQGRKYIIALRKAQQFDKFLSEISRIQSRFTLSISRELIENLSPDNFQWVKQFCIISALNQLNSTLKNQENNETK